MAGGLTPGSRGDSFCRNGCSGVRQLFLVRKAITSSRFSFRGKYDSFRRFAIHSYERWGPAAWCGKAAGDSFCRDFCFFWSSIALSHT